MFCPGLYCGRIQYPNDTFSECGPCPLGYRSSNIYGKLTQSICIKCTDNLQLYDYLYLIFIIISQLTFYYYIIDRSIKRPILTFDTICLYISSILELFLSAFLSFLIYAFDYENYRIQYCRSLSIFDWYTVFDDQILNGKQLRCSKEIIYPLYSIVFCYLFLSFIFLLLIRIIIINKFKIINGTLTIYLSLYVIPIIGFLYFIFAGFIYYFYPFILLFGSIHSLAIHFAFKIDQQSFSLFKDLFTNKRSLIIVCGHFILHLIALIALIEIKKLSYLLLLLIPIPTIFYISTSSFTQPSRFL